MFTTFLIVIALLAVSALVLWLGRGGERSSIDASPARADSGSWLRPRS